MKIVIFDTETTGLMPKSLYLTFDNVHKFPYILQLAWIVYDLETQKTTEKNFIIECPIDIPRETINIHGITNEISKNGKDFPSVFNIFLGDVMKCDEIVGHNIHFDLSMLEIELYRHKIDKVEILFHKKRYDTMYNSVDIVKIKGTHANGNKFPKLIELYRYYFGKDFDNQHNAIGDVKATFEVFKKLRNI